MFVIVFSEQDKEYLLSKNYRLINKFDDRYIFENKGSLCFENENINYKITNKLYF